MIFDGVSKELKLLIMEKSLPHNFLQFAFKCEKDEDIDWSEIIALGNKKFKGRFLKKFKEYKVSKELKNNDNYFNRLKKNGW